MATQQRKMRILINDNYSFSERISISKSIINVILTRTDRGIGVVDSPNKKGVHSDTSKFPAYNRSYIDSTKFKAAFKNPANVNLKLSQKMIGKLKVLSHGTGFIEIGYDKGSKENAKAEGNIIGSYGGRPNSNKSRNFLGITDDELQSILRQFPLPERLSALKLLGVAALFEGTKSTTSQIGDISDLSVSEIQQQQTVSKTDVKGGKPSPKLDLDKSDINKGLIILPLFDDDDVVSSFDIDIFRRV